MDYLQPMNGTVYIFPHLEWSKKINIETLCRIVNILKKTLINLDLEIWPKSSYSLEVNGNWNVIFSINENNKKYMYMLFLDKDKIYGSPFINQEYKFILKHRSLLSNFILYKNIEDKLIDIIGPAKHITNFKKKITISPS
jgi:hypothetical protein